MSVITKTIHTSFSYIAKPILSETYLRFTNKNEQKFKMLGVFEYIFQTILSNTFCLNVTLTFIHPCYIVEEPVLGTLLTKYN